MSFGNSFALTYCVNIALLSYLNRFNSCCLWLNQGHSLNSSFAVCHFRWLQTCSARCRVLGPWRTSATSACCSTRPSRSLGSWEKWPRSAAAMLSPACAAASVWWGRCVILLTRKHTNGMFDCLATTFYFTAFCRLVCNQQVVAGVEMMTRMISSSLSELIH